MKCNYCDGLHLLNFIEFVIVVCCTTSIVPTGPPGTPYASIITTTNVILNWTEINISERNGVITSYIIIQYGEGTNRNITINTRSNATTHLITGLKPFTQYTFMVAGVNRVNTGPFSNASEVFITAEDSKYKILKN